MAGCKDQPTGVRITVRVNGVGYDELRFGVVDLNASGPAPTLVDPAGPGRKTHLAGGTNPDVVVLLDDSVDGHQILCDVAALIEGTPSGNGDGQVLARAHEIRDVYVFLAAAPGYDAGAPGDAGTDANPTGSGGNAGGLGGESGGPGVGGSGAGGANGTGGGSGTGGKTGIGGGSGTGDGGANGSGGSSGTGGSTGTGGSGAGGANGSGGSGGKPGVGALGSPCNDAGQCQSLFCVDGVCCESACGTACTSCNLNSGQAGRCRQAMNHTPDPHQICVNTGDGNCGTDGTCDNNGACTIKFGTACAAGCASPTARFSSGICNQAGACVGVGSVPCTPAMPMCIAGMCQ